MNTIRGQATKIGGSDKIMLNFEESASNIGEKEVIGFKGRAKSEVQL